MQAVVSISAGLGSFQDPRPRMHVKTPLTVTADGEAEKNVVVKRSGFGPAVIIDLSDEALELV